MPILPSPTCIPFSVLMGPSTNKDAQPLPAATPKCQGCFSPYHTDPSSQILEVFDLNMAFLLSHLLGQLHDLRSVCGLSPNVIYYLNSRLCAEQLSLQEGPSVCYKSSNSGRIELESINQCFSYLNCIKLSLAQPDRHTHSQTTLTHHSTFLSIHHVLA